MMLPGTFVWPSWDPPYGLPWDLPYFLRDPVVDLFWCVDRCEAPGDEAYRTSWGDRPQDPRFLASLGALSLVELDLCFVVELLTGCRSPKDLVVGYRISWGILPKTPVFSLRSARCHLVELDHYSAVDLLAGWTGPARRSSLGMPCLGIPGCA